MTWNATVVDVTEVDESVSAGGGSAIEDSSRAGSATGSGTVREPDKSAAGDKLNCRLDGRLGGAEYIVTSTTVPSEVATSVD